MKERKYADEGEERAGCSIWGIVTSSGGQAGPRYTYIDLVSAEASEREEVHEGFYRATLYQRLSFALHSANAAQRSAPPSCLTSELVAERARNERLEPNPQASR